MLKKLFGVVLMLMAMEGLAYPTQAELKKASSLVTDLMAENIAAFKAEKKTAKEIGDAAIELLPKAETEAVKLLLFQGAFHFYIRGKEYDKAAKVVLRVKKEISDVQSEQIVVFIERSIKKVSEKDAHELFVLYRDARVVAEARARLGKTRLMLRESPANQKLIRQLGEIQALSGDWTVALKTFARCDGDIGRIARAEKSGTRLLDVADFWWSYVSYAGTDGIPVFQAHAADVYRQVIKGGTVGGLRRDLAIKRLKQVGKCPRSPFLVVDLSSGPNGREYPLVELWESPKSGWSDEYKTEKVVLRLIECNEMVSDDHGRRLLAAETNNVPKPYYIGIFEVTQKQYELVTGTNPSHFRGDKYPVECVSYNNIRGQKMGSKYPQSTEVDVDSFMGKLRARTGCLFDLPTEQQWEFACRAGTMTKYCYGEEPNDGYMWGRENSGSQTHGVGLKLPNAWGIYDMHGNVFEWCLERMNNRERVVRGGYWGMSTKSCSSSLRCGQQPFIAWNLYGFRLVENPAD